MENKAELMEPEVINKIVKFNEFELKLAEFKKKFEGLVYDFNDPDQERAAKDDHKEVRKAYNELEVIRKDEKKPHQEKVVLIDKEGKRIKDEFDKLTTAIKDQQEAHAQIAILEAAQLHDMVTSIEDLCIFEESVGVDMESLTARLKFATELVIDNSFKSREADGHMAKAKSIEYLEGRIALAEKVEAQRITDELAAKKAQEEREEQIRKDAAAEAEKEKARVIEQAKADKMAIELQAAADAEQADEDKKNAELKAKNDAAAAKKKADDDKQTAIKAEQEKAAKAASDKIEADKKEAARIQKIADNEAAVLLAKQNNQKHRANIHKKVKVCLMRIGGVNEELAIEITKALSKKDIENVTINY